MSLPTKPLYPAIAPEITGRGREVCNPQSLFFLMPGIPLGLHSHHLLKSSERVEAVEQIQQEKGGKLFIPHGDATDSPVLRGGWACCIPVWVTALNLPACTRKVTQRETSVWMRFRWNSGKKKVCISDQKFRKLWFTASNGYNVRIQALLACWVGLLFGAMPQSPIELPLYISNIKYVFMEW